MWKEAVNQIKIASALLITLSVLTGLIYPIIVTVIAQLMYPWRANGCLINHNGKIIGSSLLGQTFTKADYFWGRPSATTPFPYNGAASSGSNSGPSNPAFLATVKERILTLQHADLQNKLPIPVDLVTASGSGLDPDISPLAAFYQIPRIAKARQKSENELQLLVQGQIQTRPFKLLGEPRVNVLQLNLALDNLGG